MNFLFILGSIHFTIFSNDIIFITVFLSVNTNLNLPCHCVNTKLKICNGTKIMFYWSLLYRMLKLVTVSLKEGNVIFAAYIYSDYHTLPLKRWLRLVLQVLWIELEGLVALSILSLFFVLFLWKVITVIYEWGTFEYFISDLFIGLTRFGLLGLQLALSNGCTYKSSFWIFCLFHFMWEYSELKIEFG